jgi:4-hydroxy-3-polyprenylbenzoate decarboxylase
VIADEGVKIQDYDALSRYVLKNFNPATDISFSQGPMDVLDHSCSKLGFGGKMCIDGTRKFDEEVDESSQLSILPSGLAIENVLKAFDEIKGVNVSLLEKEMPVLIVSVEKSRRGHVKELHQRICQHEALEGIKMILYVEHTVDANDLPVALWRFCNNLDPRRDGELLQRTSANDDTKTFTCMGLDGTIKTKAFDNFQRDWPNIIVMDDKTIQAVDEKWSRLGLGEFLLSPSLKFKNQIYGEEAVVA